MKKNLIPVLAVMCIAAFSILYSCAPSAPKEATSSSIVESDNIVGLWQKQREAFVEDESGNSLTVIQSTNLYKLINADGSFVLFRAYTDSVSGVNTSRIEMYGNYQLASDTLCQEQIVSHCLRPELSGASSQVHYQVLDGNMMSVYYNIQNDGSAGSNEWTPETWRRVSTEWAGRPVLFPIGNWQN